MDLVDHLDVNKNNTTTTTTATATATTTTATDDYNLKVTLPNTILI